MCSVISSTEQHNGQTGESHSLQQNIVVATAECPDMNLDSHIWNVGGKELIALPNKFQ